MGLIDPYKELEVMYQQFAGRKRAVSVSSGTAGLHLALVALGVGPGDEVIVPEFTMIACAWAVSYTGATPVFVDCDESLNIDVTKIEDAITDKTKAIMPVHIYGRLCDMAVVRELATRHDLFVVEDACEAQGLPSSGDLTVVSLYRNKIIHAEEGGIILTDDDYMADKLDDLKNMSFGSKHDFLHERMGFNYRLSNCQARLAIRSLLEYPKNKEKRRQIEEWYQEIIPTKPRDAVWVYDFQTDRKDERVAKHRSARHGFKPMSMQPMYKKPYEHLVAYEKSLNTMYLPVFPEMDKSDVERLCQSITL